MNLQQKTDIGTAAGNEQALKLSVGVTFGR